jgi:GTP-binding protein
MIIRSAEFLISNTDLSQCPKPDKPEYAFIGRSNVGKSSLINCLVNNRKLAKTSSTPGKTQLINHFLINDNWYLVDLPGYGYAKKAKTERKKWAGFIEKYILKRENLMCLFVLLDSRLPLQKIDEEFIVWLGEKGIPFCLVYTKTDKLGRTVVQKNVAEIERALKRNWETLPQRFLTSSETHAGREELLSFIEQCNPSFSEM